MISVIRKSRKTYFVLEEENEKFFVALKRVVCYNTLVSIFTASAEYIVEHIRGVICQKKTG